MKLISLGKLLAVFFVTATIGVAAYAFTASNTVPASNAGSGSGVVAGYVVTNLHYALDATTPADIDTLTFTVTPTIPSTSSGSVLTTVALTVGGPTNYVCTRNTTGDLVTCPTISPQLTVDKLVGVTVVAAQ